MIDWGRVNELRLEIGDEGLAEVVELFLDEVEEVVARLSSHPDPRRLEGDLHFLKGSAWNLGFDEFGALCHEGERQAAGGRGGQVALGAILDRYQQSKTAFLAGLAGRRSASAPHAA